MLLLSRSRAAMLAACIAIVGTACQPKTEPGRSAQKPAVTSKATDEESGAKSARKAAQQHKQPEPPPRPTIPKVALSDALRAACLVNVGDQMPDAELPDASGSSRVLSSFCGKKLTVLCIWTIGDTARSRLLATQTLKDLMKNVVEPFAEKGVQLVGIDVGDPVESARQHTTQAGATFPNLFDPNGDYLAKLAKDRQMPRTYLLDVSGRVLWFDVEYSRSSRQDLVQGIRVALGEL
jgi:peroxiredoxin